MPRQRYIPKNPIEISAWKWDGSYTDAGKIINWVSSSGSAGTVRAGFQTNGASSILITSNSNSFEVLPGDYVVLGADGHFSVIPEKTFESSYIRKDAVVTPSGDPVVDADIPARTARVENRDRNNGPRPRPGPAPEKR